MNESLKHFFYESVENYQNFLMTKIYDGDAIDEINKLITNGISGENENAYQHIVRRHLSMNEDDLVKIAIKTGQGQSIFAFGQDNYMTHDDFDDIKSLMLDAFSENSKEIALEQLKTEGHMRKLFTYKNNDVIGIGIDSNFNLVSTKTIAFACQTDINPLSETGICITTAYPDLSKSEEVLKTKEQLMEEYNLTEKDMQKFKFRKNHREIYKENKERLYKANEDRVLKTFLSKNFNRY